MLPNFAKRLRIFHLLIHHLDTMALEDLPLHYSSGRPAINYLFDIIKPELEEKSQRNQSISKEMQVDSECRELHTLHLLTSADHGDSG